MNTPKSRFALLGLAFGILLALLIAPQTRWVVRLPFLIPTALPDYDSVARQRVVEEHPNDLQIQLAGRPQNSSQTSVDYDRSLVAKFPNSASLRAAILREATTREVRLHRDEDNLLAGTPIVPFQPGPDDPMPSAAQLRQFDADAAAGERLDPDNAYFPFIRSIGLFAQHRDAEALAAVERASQKHVWNEYFQDEVEGGWRINDAIYGGQEALSASAVSGGLLFPQYAQLREVARVVVYKAILDEQAGHPEAGLTTRLALARVGELIQVKATTLIGNLVGGAINAIATDRPGGGAFQPPDPHLSGLQRRQTQIDAYCAYVTKIGHPEAAAEARADDQTWQQIHRITSHIDNYFLGSRLTTITRTGIAFFVCLALLPNILCFFVLGLLASALSRLPRIRDCRPLPTGVATGFWLPVMIGLLLTGFFLANGLEGFAVSAALAAGVPLGIAGLLALFVPRLRPRITAGLVAACLTVAVAAVFGIASSWQAVTLELIALCFALPVLMTLIWGIASLIKRVPFSVKAVEGFQAVMPLLVCGLMLVYGGLLMWTVQQEARANYGLERSLHGEGQYLALVIGETWPQG